MYNSYRLTLTQTHYIMIKSYHCKYTEMLAQRAYVKRFHAFSDQARRKLRMLDTTTKLEDLRVPPANHLEALKGNRAGQHSIRINKQWRLCFTWHDGHAYDVEIVDYH